MATVILKGIAQRAYNSSKRSWVLHRIVSLTRPAISDYIGLFRSNKTVFMRVNMVLKYLVKHPNGGKALKLELKDKRFYKVGIYRIIYAIESNFLRIYSIDYSH